MKKLIFNSNIKYSLVMILGFSLDFILYSFMIHNNIPYYFSNFISYMIGSFICVVLIRLFVFTSPRFKLFVDYLFTLMSNGSVFLFGFILLGILISFNINAFLAKLISNLITFIVNMFIRKSFF